MKFSSETMEMTNLLRVLVIIGMISCEDKGGVRLVVRVGEDVVLPCSLGPEVDIQPAVFDWTKDRQDVFLFNSGICYSENPQFKGRVSHFPDELKKGNASITIRNIQPPDSGNYSCFFPHLQQQRFNIELLVGASPKPYVSILSITEDWAVLQCEIRGAFPKPQISWLDSDGIVLPAEEKLEDSDGLQHPEALMLQTTVTKSGIFRCRVVQQELNHINEVNIYALISSDKTARRFDKLHLILVCLIVVLTVLYLMMVWWMCKRRAMVVRHCIRFKAERSTWERHQAKLKAERSTWETFDSGVSFPRPSDDLKRHQAKLEAERSAVETFDSGVSFPRPSDDLKRLQAKLEAERSTWETFDSGVSFPRPSDDLTKRCDSGVSANHSSDSLIKLQETGEPKLKAAPDETSKMIPEETVNDVKQFPSL